jgi:hypothetical protein
MQDDLYGGGRENIPKNKKSTGKLLFCVKKIFFFAKSDRIKKNALYLQLIKTKK